MSRYMPIRLGVLLLGLWVTIAPAVYAMPMAAMMQQSGLTDEADAGGCEGCPDLDEERAICAQLCLIASLVAVSTEDEGFPPAIYESYAPGRHPAARDFHSPPDPAPPKSTILH